MKTHQQEQRRLEGKTPSSLAAKLHSAGGQEVVFDPNRRYLHCRLVHLKALVDFISPKEDEFVYATLSFLK